MKTVLLISIAAFTVACNGSRHENTDTSANATGAKPLASPAAATANRAVTLVGCLQGPSRSGATGTAGAAAAPRASAPAAGSDAAGHGATDVSRFVLTNAAVESGDTGAVSAGASGGTVASAGSSFELDGLPADAQASVNKRVRVTGRLHPRVATTIGARGDAAGTRAASGTATAAPSTTGENSTRDDVRANSLGVAGDSTSHRLTVETLQVVAQQCGPQ